MSTGWNHWQRLADNWHLVGPPLRPDRADQDVFNSLLHDWTVSNPDCQAINALLLGVTPELVHLAWPPATELRALDASAAMIRAVWQGEPGKALVGSWTRAPLAAESQHIVLLDGGFGVLRYPDLQLQLLQEVSRMLLPGGIFAVRLFAPAGRTGSLQDLRLGLATGRIASLDALKLHLWGALQAELALGVRPADVVAHIDALGEASAWTSGTPGWHPRHIGTLALHRQSKAVYHLPNEHELQEMAQGIPGLEVLSVDYPANAYGFCCPIVCLRKTHKAPADSSAPRAPVS